MASATVLPKELRLSAPPTMPQARSYMFKQQSAQTDNIKCGDTFHINLPRLQRSYLTKDSYLKFVVEAKMTTQIANDGDDNYARFQAYWDTIGAAGLIHKIEVYDYLGSTLLESITGVAELVTLLTDLGVTHDEIAKHYSVTQGTRPSSIVNEDGTAITLDTFGAGANAIVPTYGQSIFNKPSATEVTYNREFALPLFSFLGLLSEKFVPLHNGFTIAITLNQQSVALGTIQAWDIPEEGDPAVEYVPPRDGTAGNLSITLHDVYFCSQILELGPEAESLLMSSAGPNPLIIPTKAYRNYVGFLPKASPSFRLDLNLNVASLTNIMWIMRNADYTKPHWRSLSHRIRNFLQSWYFQYGSSMLPQTSGIQCRAKNVGPTKRPQPEGATGIEVGRFDHSEAYYELVKARHKFNAPLHNGLIDLYNFTYDRDSVGVDAAPFPESVLWPGNKISPGKFAAGIDLELISGRSNELISGMNTNGMNTSINATFDPEFINSMVDARVDAWCEYDSFINVAPGIATTVSF